MSSEIDCSDWYQIICPLPSLYFQARKPSRIEILKLGGECNQEFWSKVPWDLVKKSRKEELNCFSRSPRHHFFEKPGKTVSFERIRAAREQCLAFSERNSNHDRDQSREVERKFWKLFDSADPKCPDGIDIEAIRAALEKRRAELGRGPIGGVDGDENLFDKYGLGMHARKLLGDETEPYPVHQEPMNQLNNLLNMIDRMTDERTKSTLQGEDVFDKNRPITGNVGFWREEINGIREFTDLDEALSFGDLLNDADFKKYLEQKGRIRFDSRGNVIFFDEAAIPEEDHIDKSQRRKNQGKSIISKPINNRISTSYSTVDRKPRRYPEWEFPMCNYPKWVHQMYRMDQVKIGQLVKQGSVAAEYCSTWTASDNRNIIYDKFGSEAKWHWSKEDTSNQDSTSAERRGVVGKRGKIGLTSDAVIAEGKASAEPAVLFASDRPKNGTEYLQDSASTFGLKEFMQKYEKDQRDLGNFETDSYGNIIPKDDLVDINDLIKEYQGTFKNKQDLLEGEINKRKREEEKQGNAKKMQDEAMKALENLRNKELQDRFLKQQQQEEILAQKLKSGEKQSTKIGVESVVKKVEKTRLQPIIVCKRAKSWPIDERKNIECMDRFKILLRAEDNVVSHQGQIWDLVKQITHTKSALAKKLTPCEKAEMNIC